MAKSKHSDVDFVVGTFSSRNISTDINSFKTFNEAAGNAIGRAASSGREMAIDIIIYSKSGARWWAGDEGVEQYEEDPDASVFERFVIKAHSEGRIP